MNLDNIEEDIWVISSWRTDIPNKVQYIKQYMASACFPDCCRQVLHLLNKYFESSSPDSIQAPALFVSAFLVELIDQYLFHIVDKTRLTSLQELRLLEVMAKYFKEQKNEFVRWCVFDVAFSFSNQEQKENKFTRRMDLLTKLVSMAIALKNGHILDCMALWMQKHRQAASIVVQVSMAIIDDYTCVVPLSLPFLQCVSSTSPQFACQLIVALTSTYTMMPKKDSSSLPSKLYPTVSALKVVVKWISQDPSVCLIKPNRTLVTLPSLHSPPTSTSDSVPLPLCPIQGLVQWTVLEPLTRYDTSRHSLEDVYSELHLGVLQALIMSGQSKRNPKDEMELEPGEVMDESDMLRHLLNSNDLKTLTATMMTMIDGLNSDTNLAIDRLAQVIQVAIATGCLSSSKSELLTICKSVLYNKLLETVVSTLDSL